MNRRSFFRAMIGGVAAAAAVRTWPFRVFSFPTEITIASPMEMFWMFGHNLYLNNPRHHCKITGVTVPELEIRKIKSPLEIKKGTGFWEGTYLPVTE